MPQLCVVTFLLFLIANATKSNLVCRNTNMMDGECKTEISFLKTLKGDVGQKGYPGKKGQKGLQGLKGEDVKTVVYNTAKSYCPGVTFHFPRGNQTTDYVRYRAHVASMKEATVCAWIEIKNLLPHGPIFSYATIDFHNALLIDLKSTSIKIYIGSQSQVFDFATQRTNPVHVCVSISSLRKTTSLFVDSDQVTSVQIQPFTSIQGGGSLVLGQDQDKVDAKGFVAEESFSGNITNLLVWPRVLSNQEINDIAKKCECPQDYSLAMTMDRSELHGEAEYIPSECPKLNPST